MVAIVIWLVVEFQPMNETYATVKLDPSSPSFGVNIKKYVRNHHLVMFQRGKFSYDALGCFQ